MVIEIIPDAIEKLGANKDSPFFSVKFPDSSDDEGTSVFQRHLEVIHPSVLPEHDIYTYWLQTKSLTSPQ
jgi:hypothetical protein